MSEQVLIVGKKEVLEFLKANPQRVEQVWVEQRKKKGSQEVLSLCKQHKIRLQYVDLNHLNKLSLTKHQGYVAKIIPSAYFKPEEILAKAKTSPLPVLLALDQLQDPVNIGNLARTAYSLGAAGLILPKDRTASLYPGAYKSSAGALNHLPVARIVNLARFLTLCQDNNFSTYFSGISTDCKEVYKIKISWPAILVLGNEEKGVRPNVAKKCQLGLKIPMLREFDSLNVAQAGGILLGEFLRQRITT